MIDMQRQKRRRQGERRAGRVPMVTALLASVVVLSGCDYWQGGDIVPGTSTFFLPWRPAIAAPVPQYEALETAGRPVMRATTLLDSGTSVVLRQLASSASGEVVWLAPNGSGFVFHSGILTAIRGPEGNLMSADPGELAIFLSGGNAAGRITHFESDLDGENHIVTHSYACDVTRSRKDDSFVVREDCTAGPNHMINIFEMGKDGRILRSRQHGFLFDDIG